MSLAAVRARKSFDAICAGETRVRVHNTRTTHDGAVRVALGLAKTGVRVGIASRIGDEAEGREARAALERRGVDVEGLAFAARESGVLVVDARGSVERRSSRWTSPSQDSEPLFTIPEGWSAELLFLSGLSPVVPHAAATCRAARSARRAGSLVFLDVDAGLHAWAGRDPRSIQMVLREVDVARCSVADLAVLGVDRAEVRAALRPSATLVITEGARHVASGPFGEVAFEGPRSEVDPLAGRPQGPDRGGDVFAAVLARNLLTKPVPGETTASAWHRALRDAHAARYSA